MNSRRNPRFHRRRTPCARTIGVGGHEARTSFGTARVGYRRLMLIWHFVRKNDWWPTPNRAQSQEKKLTKFEKGGNCGLPVHTHLGLPSAPAPQVQVLHARWFFPRLPPSEQIRSTRRTHRLARNARDPRGGERTESLRTCPRDRRFRSSARSRAHESRSGDAFDSTLEIALGCGDARGDPRRCRERCDPPPSRDPPVVWESAGDRRRARDSSRRRRHATRRPPPTRAQRDRGFRVRAFGDERALALALPSTLSDPPPSSFPPSHSPRTRRSTSSRPVRCRC